MPDGNPISALARMAGRVIAAARTRCPRLSASTAAKAAVCRRPRPRTCLASTSMDSRRQTEGLLCSKLGPDASTADGIEAFVATVDRRPGPARRARQMLYGGMEAEWAAPAGGQSLRWVWDELRIRRELFRRRAGRGLPAPSGRDGLRCRRAAGQARVRDRGLPGRSAGGDRRRHGRGGLARRGRRCRSACSKRGVPPRFSPALPRDRLAAIGRLGFGRFEKVALRFAEPFWREAGLPRTRWSSPAIPGSGWSG